MFKNITVLEIADDVEQFFRVSHALQVPNNFILFGRTAGMLNGLCATLDPELNLIELAKPYAVEFLKAERGLWSQLTRHAREWGDVILSLPQELHTFLSRANRGEFQTLMSSEDVSGRISQLYRLSHRTLLAAVSLGGVWSAILLSERGYAVATAACAVGAAIAFGLFLASVARG